MPRRRAAGLKRGILALSGQMSEKKYVVLMVICVRIFEIRARVSVPRLIHHGFSRSRHFFTLPILSQPPFDPVPSTMARTMQRAVATRRRTPRPLYSALPRKRVAGKSLPKPTGGKRKPPPVEPPVPEEPAGPPPPFGEPAGYPPGHEQHPIVVEDEIEDSGSETEVVDSDGDDEPIEDLDRTMRFIQAIEDKHERGLNTIKPVDYPNR